MKKKILVFIVLVVLLISLTANFIFFMVSKNSHVNGGNDAHFYVYGNEVTLKVDGCLLWLDEKQRSKEFRQYWKINASVLNGKTRCTIMDVWDHGSTIIIPDPEDCVLSNIDEQAKTATISYKDAILTINRDRTIWTTSDPKEKGGGELVRCWDQRINWYPL